MQVHDVSDPRVKKLGVDALPAIVGWLPNGEKLILKTGISVKDIKSAVHDLSNILDSFEKESKKQTSSQSKKAQADPEDSHIQLLSRSNFDALCGEKTPVCIIGAFRSSKAREKLESLLTLVSEDFIYLLVKRVYIQILSCANSQREHYYFRSHRSPCQENQIEEAALGTPFPMLF